MHPLQINSNDSFKYGKSDFKLCIKAPFKIAGGVIMLCVSGEAHIYINLQKHIINADSEINLLPGWIITFESVTDDFEVEFLTYSLLLQREASFRIEPAWFRYLREYPCYQGNEMSREYIKLLLRAGEIIQEDIQNRFREQIMTNHLRSYFLNIYDKVERHLEQFKMRGFTRKEELIHKFIMLVIAKSTTEHEVEYYAGKLFISSRYLTAICRSILKGESAKDVIDRHLVLEIKVLLQYSNMTMQEIADKLSFSDQSNFGRFFKKMTGMTPKQYRNKHVL